jgi:predicted Zn-ribbon and HTH transcriptional regulator
MKRKTKEPFIPVERHETIRQEISLLLENRTLSAKEISLEIRVSEKEIYAHLEHIQKTLTKRDKQFIVMPSSCKKCGFIFRKRDRLKKPGKCPVCRSESIREPSFSIRQE